MRSWLLGLVLVPSLAAAVPTTTVQQGRLLTASGQPLDGSYTALFSLYTSQGAAVGTHVWQESQPIVAQDGTYAVVLGNATPLDATLLAPADLWLGVSIDGTELARTKLHAAPYAVAADGARTLTRTDCAVGQVLARTAGGWACQDLPTTARSVYTRWGRTVCPSDASLVYSGWMVAGHYNQIGGTSSYLCAHETPQYDSYDDGDQSNGLLYKVEFETNGNGIPATAMTSVHNYEARCAVCEVPRSLSLMIPARRSCPTNWTLAYEGYLMNNYHAGHNNNFETICVDKNPEAHGGSGNEDGGLLYPVEFLNGGGGIPYTGGRELTCVVCTK